MDGHVLLYGLLAEFDDESKLKAAVTRLLDDGYRQVETYTPYPVHGMPETLRLPPSRMPVVMFAGGLPGALAGFFLCYWCSVYAYPLNVGGRPLNSWPMFIPITFEVTVLLSSLVGVLAMLALNGLPLPHHPLFNVPEFARASQDRFFICVEATDPKFDPRNTKEFLASLTPAPVVEVPQ